MGKIKIFIHKSTEGGAAGLGIIPWKKNSFLVLPLELMVNKVKKICK